MRGRCESEWRESGREERLECPGRDSWRFQWQKPLLNSVERSPPSLPATLSAIDQDNPENSCNIFFPIWISSFFFSSMYYKCAEWMSSMNDWSLSSFIFFLGGRTRTERTVIPLDERSCEHVRSFRNVSLGCPQSHIMTHIWVAISGWLWGCCFFNHCYWSSSWSCFCVFV